MERIIEKKYTITNLTNSSILLKNDNLEDRKIMVSGTIHLQFDIGEKVRTKDVYNDDYHKLICNILGVGYYDKDGFKEKMKEFIDKLNKNNYDIKYDKD